MSYFEFPHTRTYDTDLGWIIKHLIEMSKELRNFINLNTIKYADPIAWNITTQYETNTVVIDPADGTAYLSTQPVPSGVLITNTDYWTPIFNYGENLNTLREQIAAANEELSPTSTSSYNEGDLVWLNGFLYICSTNITPGTAFVIGSNIEPITIEDLIHNEDLRIYNEITQVIEDTRYTVADYGIFPDGTDCADALQELLDQGINLIFPDGVYIVGKRLINNNGCSIYGSGSQTTVLKFTGVNAQAGIDSVIGNSGLSTNPPLKRSVTIADITIQNASAVSYAALRFDGSSVISDRTTTGPTVKDVVITGEDTYGWDTGVYLYACNGAVLHNVSICGTRPGGGTYGIRIDTPAGYTIGTEFLITDCRVSYFFYDLFANRAEGIAVSNCVFLATNYGIHWESDTGNHPHLVVSNTHLNCTWKNIVTENVYQVLIYGNLIYQVNSQSHNDSRAIHIKGTGTNSVISDNVIIGITNGNNNTTAIEFDSNRSSIKNNIINMGGGGVGIMLGSNSTRNEILSNIISALTRFINNGTLNRNDLETTGTVSNVDAGVSLAGQNYVEYLQDGVLASLSFSIGSGGVAAGSVLFKISVPSTVEVMGNFAVYPFATGFGTKVLRIESDGTVKNTTALVAGEKYHFTLFLKYAVV